MRFQIRRLNIVLTVFICCVIFLPIARAWQTDLNGECASRLRTMGSGISMYSQDYDEIFPATKNLPLLHQILLPYVKDPTVYVCPATGVDYDANPALDGQTLASVGDLSRVWAVKDAKPHSDRSRRVDYLDGHVTGPSGGDHLPPDQECIEDERKLALATLMYTQDYDETLPLMKNYTGFKADLFPYLKETRPFHCPATHLTYLVNFHLSGSSLASIPDPNNMLLLTDRKPHPDGKVTTVYLSGRVVQQ